MPNWPSSNPIRTILWFIRGLAILMLVVGLLSGQHVLSELNAILVVTVVVSFFIEPRLLSRFAARPDESEGQPPQTSSGSKFADARFAFLVGAMRVIGGLFVAVGLLGATMTVSNWSQSVREDGGTGGAIGTLVFVSAFVGVGVLLVLGRHIPVMRALREMGEQQRRGR